MPSLKDFEREKSIIRARLREADIIPTDDMVLRLHAAVEQIITQRATPEWQHPALALHKQLTGVTLAPVVKDEFKARIGPRPDLAKLRAVIMAWTLRGYNAQNIEGLLDWYEQGIPALKAPAAGSTLSELGII